jgi:hypothetical protein
MDTIRYITDARGGHSGLMIDFESAKKSIKSGKDIIALIEEIEDIVAVELSKNEKSLNYEEARKQLFGKGK